MSEQLEKDSQLAEIKTFISFAMEASEQAKALQVVERYEDDPLMRRLFHAHYSALPDALEEPVLKVYQLAFKHGVHCFLLEVKSCSFVYLVSVDEVLCAGSRVEDFSDELIAFIDLGDKEKLAQLFRDSSNFPEYSPEQAGETPVCPICGVSVGEVHVLGCIAEICPWCDSQLSNCNCRFDKMGIEEFTREEHLEAFEELLEEAGRIPFSADEKIGYPGMSEGLDKGQTE